MLQLHWSLMFWNNLWSFWLSLHLMRLCSTLFFPFLSFLRNCVYTVYTRVGCTVSKNRSFGLQSSTFGVLGEMQWRIRFCNFFPFSKFLSYRELRANKISVRGKVKIFFWTEVLFMVLKRSVFEIQKQRTKNFKDQSYGYGVIHENVPKLCNCEKWRNFRPFLWILRNHNSKKEKNCRICFFIAFHIKPQRCLIVIQKICFYSLYNLL